MLPLDPLNLPLRGQILIEASAGTGKTFTLALLVLRLLLEEELTIDQVLVVTFTRAATEELRGRIRLRLREALDHLEQQPGGDPLLDRIITRAMGNKPAGDKRLAILLRDSLNRMDEAAIHTIHGFCQRMLREYAFATGAPFSADFIEDEDRLRRQIMADFWRLHFYDNPAAADWAGTIFQTPDGLLAALGGHFNRPDLVCLPHIDKRELLALEQETAKLFVRARELWAREQAPLLALLMEHEGLSRAHKDGYHPDRLKKAHEQLDEWLTGAEPPWLMPRLAHLFTATTVERRRIGIKKGIPSPTHPFLDLFARLHDLHVRLARGRKIHYLLAGRRFLATELKRRKTARDQLSHDDLLRQMATALRDNRRLARLIHRHFPAMLVDEFQDTDPLQYQIFSTIHREGDRHGLFLIGDPKQAIYGFRGADIFTYLAARRDTRPEHRFTMTTNYRSASAMVAAVNRVFARDNPFLLARGDIPFIAMKPGPEADREAFVRRGRPAPPLACLLLEDRDNQRPWSKEQATSLAAERCAAEIATLLAQGRTGDALIGDRGVSGGDIAILVRTHDEAAAVQKALRGHRITALYAGRESVFATPEAATMHTLLTCLHNPTDTGLIRNLLVTDLFAHTAEMLDTLSEQEWEAIMAEIGDLARLHRQQGVLVMFFALLKKRRVVARLLGRTGGERMLTNLIHLAELLQEVPASPGGEMTLRWLADRMRDPDSGGDAAQLRLESDERLVRIITIHRAKGLEFALVFLPFPWSARPERGKGPFCFHDPDQDNGLRLDLGSGEARNLGLAEQERLAEDLRLLYVAITRARHCCFFCWGRISSMDQSALFYLLHDHWPLSHAEITARLADLHGRDWRCEIPTGQQDQATALPDEEEERPGPTGPLVFDASINDSWRIMSYSSLTGGGDGAPERPDHDSLALETALPAAGTGRFGFPRGAAAGTCLHAILEEISFTDRADHREIIARHLAAAGFAETWTPVVSQWIGEILATEIQPGLSLARIDAGNRLNELAFAYPITALNRPEFNRILARHGHDPLPGGEEGLRGLMVGFIDLVFRHQGRYFIADYKSNHLGSAWPDYSQDRLAGAMRAHRYDLQYLFYTLALHRHLTARLPGYEPATHLGPVCYLFLRGMNPGAPGSGVFQHQLAPELITALDACIKGEPS